MMKVDQEPARALPEPARRIPPGMTVYKRTPDFDPDTVPAGLLRAHSTKPGTWGRICVVEGTLLYRVLDERRQCREWLLTPLKQGIVEPTILHEVELTGPVTFFVEFLRKPAEATV